VAPRGADRGGLRVGPAQGGGHFGGSGTEPARPRRWAHGRRGTTAAAPDANELVARARASAALGEIVDLAFPKGSGSPLPPIPTFFDRTANASLDDLIRMGRLLVERLARPDCQINVAVEREIADTAVGNTAGARASIAPLGSP